MTAAAAARPKARKKGQGFKWIRVSTRFAIYARDGFRCSYCSVAFSEDGRGLSLDHLVANELGGTNEPKNLVTSCTSCNSSKSDLTLRAFFARLRSEKAVDATKIGRRIRRLVHKPLDRAEGRRLAEARRRS